jgi:predicted peptidase
MKSVNSALFFVFCTIFSATSFAQTKKTLFDAYPKTISLSKTSITDAFANNTGSLVSIDLSSDFKFAGTVVSNQQKYENLQTIIIRSSENNKSVFQISKIINKDNSISYAGLIINQDAADGYIIKKINNIYVLQKFESGKILEPCKL